MTEVLRLATSGGIDDAAEPFGLWTATAEAPTAWPDLRARRFEFSSRGDRVPGRLLLPSEGAGPFPLVLLLHGFGGSAGAAYIEATGAPWAQRGAAVASIDLPLHGARADQKLVPYVAPERSGEHAHMLRVEFARQAVTDLSRSLTALAALPEVDADRVVFAGFSLGAILGAPFCALDPRPRAVALALGGAGLAPEEVDPASYVARLAPRPLLLVNGTRDTQIPRSAAVALFEAASEPKEQHWFDAGHEALPGAALKTMWEFLAPHLGLV